MEDSPGRSSGAILVESEFMKTLTLRSVWPGKPARLLVPAVVLAAVASVGACAGGTGDPAQPDDLPTGTTVTVVEPAESTSAGSATPVRESAATATVPDVVGMNHQQAQDAMQAAGFYGLREVDATGQGRALLWDRNWIVVSQSPEGGVDASVDSTVTLSSKKEGE